SASNASFLLYAKSIQGRSMTSPATAFFCSQARMTSGVPSLEPVSEINTKSTSERTLSSARAMTPASFLTIIATPMVVIGSSNRERVYQVSSVGGGGEELDPGATPANPALPVTNESCPGAQYCACAAGSDSSAAAQSMMCCQWFTLSGVMVVAAVAI